MLQSFDNYGVKMTTVYLIAEITESGELKVNLPAGLPPGRVELAIEYTDQSWVHEELAKSMQADLMMGAEFAESHRVVNRQERSTTDDGAQLQEQRRKRNKQGWLN